MRDITRSRGSGGNLSGVSCFRTIASFLVLVMLSLLAGQASVRAGTVVTSSQVPGPWGQISNNFQLSISTTDNIISFGSPLMLSTYLRNLGPEVVFRTFDLPDEYQLVCRSTSATGGCTRRSAMLSAHNIGRGSFDLHNKTDIYKTIIDIADIYDIEPGTYQMRLVFPVLPTNNRAPISSKHPTASPISNSITVTVLK
jgi:hypothetical protein